MTNPTARESAQAELSREGATPYNADQINALREEDDLRECESRLIATVDSLATANLAQAERIERLVRLLRKLEWVYASDLSIVCSSCGEYKHDGHKPDCPLDAELKGGE